MTVPELAKRLNVSQQAIYQKLKRKGIKLDTIRDSEGQLTVDGETMIESMFKQTKSTDSTYQINKLYSEREQMRERIKDLEREQEQLESDLNARNAIIQEQKNKIEEQAETIQMLREDKGYLQLTLQKEQENYKQSMLLLAPPKQESVFKRLRNMLGGRNNDGQ